jgi:hypothetical protein
MFAKLKQTVATMMVLLGFSAEAEIPINATEKKLDLSAEQVKKLEAALGPDYAKKMFSAIDGEIKAHLDKNMDLKAMQDELDAIIKENQLNAEDVNRAQEENADEGTVAAKMELLNSSMSAMKKKNGELEAAVQKLMEQPEGDVPTAIIRNLGKTTMEHSATHLFASNKSYDAIDKRPWNQRAVKGDYKATTFKDDSEIPLLKGDVEHFVRENPEFIESLFNDTDVLPTDWSYTTNVQDRISTGYVIAAEIVQGRKKGWAPKNNFHFDTETGQVYRKKIDIEFDGYELQELENTWIGRIKDMSGSHPWKLSFVAFLLTELSKQQIVDDRNAQINGIYAVGGKGEAPGYAVNSQNGLRYLWYYYRDIVKKYRAFSIGVPTDMNIVDYIEKMILMIPENVRKNQGFEIQLSERWKLAYNKKAAERYTLAMNTDEGKTTYSLNYPIDRPNFKFQVLKDQTQTDFIGITYSKNVDVMEYKPEEKNRFTTTFDGRNMKIFADYRLGIRFIFVGTKKVKDTDPQLFEKQMLWSNDVPVFGTETKVPVFDNKSGALQVVYKNMVIDEGWVTDVTEIDGDFTPGQVITITGNTSLAGAKSIKNGDVFSLTGNADYPLNTAGTITLFVNENKTLRELSRTTTAPAIASTDVSFTGAALDADMGKIFRYNGTAATTGLTNIINGVEGQSIKIYGKAGNAVLTLSDTGNINVVSNATLNDAADVIQLTLVNGTWMETNRTITA